MVQQLRLVTDEQDRAHSAAPGPVERLFAHWVFMMGKNPRRCALGPTRRKALVQALKLYPEAELALAIEGCAASPFHAGENDRETEYNDLTLIMRDEAHIERFAALGQQLREQMAAAQASEQRAASSQAPQVSAEQAAADRERVRAWAARRSGRASA